MVDFADIARMARKRLDRHEAELFEGDGRGQFDDPDGGLLRYGRALRRVLTLCDTWDTADLADPGIAILREWGYRTHAYDMALALAEAVLDGKIP